MSQLVMIEMDCCTQLDCSVYIEYEASARTHLFYGLSNFRQIRQYKSNQARLGRLAELHASKQASKTMHDVDVGKRV